MSLYMLEKFKLGSKIRAALILVPILWRGIPGSIICMLSITLSADVPREGKSQLKSTGNNGARLPMTRVQHIISLCVSSSKPQ